MKTLIVLIYYMLTPETDYEKEYGKTNNRNGR